MSSRARGFDRTCQSTVIVECNFHQDPLQPQARARRTTYASSYPFPTPVINFAWQCGLLGITAPPVLAGSPIENEMHLRAVLEREYREIYVENLGWDVT
ncbi:hypothetical protein GN244_ATG10923 [Phytophthora infestans]|uniref:Uncharacterized protein n=1 Tax=Phytophthora infestans TaxID=4787 RepID=A0A833WCQ3_PHYIN|nr:hypothetical protein GN244_ATG19716 [Phytophthora infestans]KAF4037072.1 hypothetical protein GN244_ATG10923 [Phytophthora infestans]